MRKQVNIFDYTSGITYLNEYFEEMKTVNPRLSLRALASKLGLDQSTLSRYFAGERFISAEKAAEMGPKLKLDDAETNYLKLLFLFGDRGEVELLKKLKLSFLFDKKVRELGGDGLEKFDTASLKMVTTLVPTRHENRDKISDAIQNMSESLKEFAVAEQTDDIILVSCLIMNIMKDIPALP